MCQEPSTSSLTIIWACIVLSGFRTHLRQSKEMKRKIDRLFFLSATTAIETPFSLTNPACFSFHICQRVCIDYWQVFTFCED